MYWYRLQIIADEIKIWQRCVICNNGRLAKFAFLCDSPAPWHAGCSLREHQASRRSVYSSGRKIILTLHRILDFHGGGYEDAVFWDVAPRGLIIQGRFARTCRRNMQERKSVSVSYRLIWRWRRYISPKRLSILNPHPRRRHSSISTFSILLAWLMHINWRPASNWTPCMQIT
jgi:hypothetical protein